MATADQSSTNGTEGGDVLTTDAKDLMCEKLLASEEMEQKIPTVYHQFVSPRTITGPANQLNVTKGAIDWSYNGLVAYGSNYTVVVMDTTNMQPVQCLDRHKAIVNNVLWSHRVRSKVDESASVELMSSDMTGHIIHWDITIGTPLVVLQDGNKPVLGTFTVW
ncbi:WD repeat-containing protein 11 [Homalodisca vitripennis]|nr:WD repeat-containing protein 11 [Homalodisca vitripennis]